MSHKPFPDALRREIRRRYYTAPLRAGWRGGRRRTVTQRQLSFEFNVSQSTIHRILTEES